MNTDQAYRILDYSVVPEKREDRIKLIQIMGYTKLRGGNLLPDCHDQQLLRVAERLFKKAGNTVHAELNAQLREIRDEEDLIQYHAFLCDIFNIPEELRDTVTISELEDELQK